MEGRFRNGNVVGRAWYYTMEGKLERKEISRFNKLKTTFYYPDHTVRLKGNARLESNAEKAHYYFYGTWKYFDEEGKLLKYCYYEKGRLIRTEYVDKNNLTNDSLVNALNMFEKRFMESAALISKINSSIVLDPGNTEKFSTQLIEQQSELFTEVDLYLQQFGYPSVKVVGESSTIPFFIISYGTTGIREKYLELFEKAVKDGNLAPKTFAYFVDKLKVAKGEKQVYGTQSYLDQKKKEWVDYPSVDPENLEKRRAEAGF